MTHASEAPSEGYLNLVNHVPNGVLVLFDAELRYLIVGPETLPFSKREASGMVGKKIDELFPEETVTQLEPKLRATILGESCSFDMEYEENVHHIETEPVRIEGDTYGALLTQEVTEERQTARELKRQNERLDEFASTVSHDLRNPLRTVRGYLDLARDEPEPEHFERIEHSLDRLERIIEDILWLAREGRGIGSTDRVDLPEVIIDAWGVVAPGDGDAELEYDAEALGSLIADYDRVCQLLENVFGNAIEHGGSDVTVRIDPMQNGFAIEDDGPGMPASIRDTVFEQGFSTDESGTGFGLYIVKQIAEAHGWKVAIDESETGGVRLEITGVQTLSADG